LRLGAFQEKKDGAARRPYQRNVVLYLKSFANIP